MSRTLALIALLPACHRAVMGTTISAQLEVTPASAVLTAGTTTMLLAERVLPDGARSAANVEWSTSSTATATVAADGTLSAIAAGTATITAVELDLGQIQTVSVTVTNATLDHIEITPASVSVALGTEQAFVATGVYSNATTADLTELVTWSTSSPSIASVSNLSGSKGRASTVGIGACTIVATGPAALSATANLTVTSAALASIAVTPSSAQIAANTTQPLVATGTFSDGTTQDLTATASWSSSNTGIATVVSGGGDAGLCSGLAPGSSTITATDAASGISGSAELTISNATLQSIAVTPTSPSIALGSNQQFVAVGTFSDATQQDLSSSVSWSSSDTGTASITSGGLDAGYASSVAAGTTTIAATDTNSAISGNTTLTVTPAVLQSLAVTPTTPTLGLGGDLQFTATGTYSDNSTQDLTAAVTWSSSDTGTATISNAGGSEGLASSVANGTTSITATEPGTSLSDATTLTVASGSIALRAATSASEPSGVTTLTIATPAGTSQDDVLVAYVAVRPGNSTVTPPTGWTLRISSTNSGAGASNSLHVYTRIATSSEPSSYAFTLSNSTGSAGGVLAYDGVDTTDPIDDSASQGNASALTQPAPSVTSTIANTVLVTAHSLVSSATWTPPGGMTERVDTASLPPPDAQGISLSVNDEPRPAAGATGTRTATASGDADAGNGVALVLRPQ